MDLNLVRVFVAIHETRSLTLAGKQLFVTQSAVSQALGRLRQHFDDPLFERVGREMRPTPVADDVFVGFREALTRIERTLDDVHGFDATNSERVFRIALSELGEIGWLPALFDAVHHKASGVRIEVVSLIPEVLPEWLSRGSIDCAVTPAQLPGEFERTHVKRQGYVVVMSSKNELARQPLTPERYQAASHVTVASDSGTPLLDAAKQRAGVAVEPLVTVQHFSTLQQLLAHSDELIATIPEAIAGGWSRTWPIMIQELPFDMSPIELSLYRRRTTQHPGALDWFYATVARAIEGSTGEFSALHAVSTDGDGEGSHPTDG
ncbi:LysR family transcriptional regulator [Kocuria rosea]|uniref:LysR family transcriptional regulator n=1 Tax=Kocuria rosea TaxID=1275 RepID=UPI002B2496ED|nr:LysR family transcriptional regulator [Kocuria rosea]MEB2528712.1 LysR family transcriptional regulator [Kocuria rosea]MEB2619590.1 LysR family transcriptional regulator [Kocuria rosea]